MSYIFDPLNYGYEPVATFPELAGQVGSSSFVKVITISSSERPTYWFSSCSKIGLAGDERWVFEGGSWQLESDNTSGHQEYLGTITSHEYAVMLLSHLFGTCKGSGVAEYGIKRLERNINAKRLNCESFN